MKTEGKDRFLSEHPEVERLIRDLPKDQVTAVILFGSQATGKARPYSDIDICLLTIPDLGREAKDTLNSFGSRTIQISLFSDLPPAVRFRVFRDGILMYGRDDLALHRARVAAVKGYLNVRPLIDRHVARTFG
jgi:predicted nucleotidyltransferase